MPRLSVSVVLASASPRRRELLSAAGVEHEVRPADLDESPRVGEEPRALVLRLAGQKALAIARDAPEAVVVGADTTVVLGSVAYAKPDDDEHARRMLRSLGCKSAGLSQLKRRRRRILGGLYR